MLSNWPGLVSRRAPACFEKDTVSPYADARLQRLTPCCFGCERTGTFQVSHRVTARLRKGLAEREGFYLPSFRKLRRYLDLNDITLYSCVFQADWQSTFRVLPSTSGYS